ncbi:bifunctional 23S rRNA (guanine(2069)-N(7))-methyltransferase RlmK/23S rRNA (guanine(2445)-N(2))-methyltransferase RlmL [Kaarinaea lacus]
MPMTSQYRFFATAPKYTEGLLLSELQACHALDSSETVGGVSFAGDLAVAYRACLWSRIANRVLLILEKTRINSADDLYAAVYDIDWLQHFAVDATFAIDFFTSDSVIKHSQFGAQRCKDAIVDQFMHACGERPSVDKKHPAIRINVHVKKHHATISLDLSGHSLHQRGYREENVEAPLKENLAAAVLLRANWPELAQAHYPLIDPMCGSGTLLIEAACMAANIAPGLYRRDFGFNAWKLHNKRLWTELRQEAETIRKQNLQSVPRIIGFDNDFRAISATKHNTTVAGFAEVIDVQQQKIAALINAGYGSHGLIVTNAPYGERLSDNQSLMPTYEQLGKQLATQFDGWRATIVTSDASLAKATGLHAKRINKLYNGKLLCRIYHFELDKGATARKSESAAKQEVSKKHAEFQPADTAIENRLKKNIKHIQKWAKKAGVSCYRIYDADLPEYNFAIDLYQSDRLFAVLQEYAAPKKIDTAKVSARRKTVLASVQNVLELPDSQIFYKQRQRQSGSSQYNKLGSSKKFHVVQESNCSFYVNFRDYLDTGLFLDHRITREMLQKKAAGKNFLNLFCYTGTASVHAALGGAVSTTSVDMSATYIDWCKRNFELNNIPLSRHHFIQADCLEWLKQETNKYDLIFIDPPTFSNSKRMDGHFDIQQHYVMLLNDCMRVLANKGKIIFSTNFRQFKFDVSRFSDVMINNITDQTIPEDFQRNRHIHQCWQIQKAGELVADD